MDLEIIDLFRKLIASLSCIEKITTDEKIKNQATKYLIDLTIQYKNFIEFYDIKSLAFKYTEGEIIDFSNMCIENKENDFVKLGEDIQFAIIDLIKILK